MKRIIVAVLVVSSCISASDAEERQLIDHGPYRNAYCGDPSGMHQLGQDTGYEDALLSNPHRVTSCASQRVLDWVLLPLNPFLMLGNSYSHGYEDGYALGASDRNKGIVDPETRKVIYCRSKKQIEKQQAPVAEQGKPVLPDPAKVGGARFAWFCSEMVGLGGAGAGYYMIADTLRGQCSFKTFCLLSAAASYPALKEARTQLAVAFPSTHPSSVSIPLPGGRTYKVTNPLEKALAGLGVAYFLSKASDSAGEPDKVFTDLAKASLIGASGYAARKLVEAGYAIKVSGEE